MNLVRKLRGVNTPSTTGSNETETSNSPHTQLGLMHLKKLFSEYTHPSHPLSDEEKADRLYNMLPLFCKIFGANTSCAEMSEKFWDLPTFCQQISLLMVSEIRKQAFKLGTDTASMAIASFFEIESSEDSSRGWLLLSALNLLAAGDANLIQIMTEATVPSTLVRCLYIFFDLPAPTCKYPQTKSTGDITPHERRVLLQKILVQLLTRLFSHPMAAEELIKQSDMDLLFQGITSTCPDYNYMWRKGTAEVLMTLSRHGLTPAVVKNIHNKKYISLCVKNIMRPDAQTEFTPLETVEMFVTLFCILKDSSDVSPVLLEDFAACRGYILLSQLLLKFDRKRETCAEAQEAIRNLVLVISSLCYCGYTELRPSPATKNSMFQLPGFQLPQPSSHGTSVRNVQSFQILQSVFLKSHSTLLCTVILDAISSIYHSDNANYFILEDENTISQFVESLPDKSTDVQQKCLHLIEFVVFQLNFIPCKELSALSLFLKTNAFKTHAATCILVMKTLLMIVKHNVIFKDAYRELGLLEVLVVCLTRYGDVLAEKSLKTDVDMNLVEDGGNFMKLGCYVIEAITLLLSACANNTAAFAEFGGAKCVHNLVQFVECRQQALGIIREIILTPGGDEDMGTLLATMHTTTGTSLRLKIDILRALLSCLRESHRTRTVFRKVGGFVYVTSALLALENQLNGESAFSINEILGLLQVVFHTLNTAMRFEPANAKFFHHEICTTTLCDTIRLLGCFHPGKNVVLQDADVGELDKTVQNDYQGMFIGNVLYPNFPDHIPPKLCFATIVMRLLYEIALDTFDKSLTNSFLTNRSPSLNRQLSSESSGSSTNGKRSAVNSLNLTPPPPEPIIVHPGVVIVMLQLLPSIQHDDRPDLALSLQMYLAEIIKSLVRTERGQQTMCDTQFLKSLLTIANGPLQNETHPLHAPLQYMLERLAAQALEPADLRQFLRLGAPLCCVPLDDADEGGGPVPLTRIKTLVSMTTPRDFRAHQSSAQAVGGGTQPPFVEFDMSAEGFGCLYLPSVAPQSSAILQSALAVGSSGVDTAVFGGIGSGDRIFPPQTGLSYSTWICVDKFSDPRNDPHCVRLLTLVRHLNNKDEQLICLSVILSARDKAIIISTQETLLPHNLGEWEPEGTGDYGARIWCPDLLNEGQWHHIAVILNRAVLKNSSLAVYVDGQCIHTQKLHYISQNPGGGAANLTLASSVYAFIGTPPAWRRYSKLCWKQGTCHLLEEVLLPSTIQTLFTLGPHYLGSLQAPSVTEHLAPLVAEEKIIFGLNAKALSMLTLAKIRKVYSKVDNKAIAKQLGMSSHENATPIRVLHNSAGHLAGAARTLGGVVIGYLGVRVFCPKPVSVMIDTVGGCSMLLGLIAMAQDVECLYAGVKALVCVVRSNKPAQNEMDRKRGYQTLAMLLRRKRHLLNSHILHLTFSLVGTVDSGRESSAIPNATAFQDLLCDLEIWHEAPGELLKSLLEHLLELVVDSSERRVNLWHMRELQLVTKLLHILNDVKHAVTRQILLSLLAALLSGQPRGCDLLWFGQFIAATLPANGVNERHLTIREADPTRSIDGEGELILLRNRCLQLLHSILWTARGSICLYVCDEISKGLGFDWLLLFMQPHIHSTTVVFALRILIVLCSLPPLLNRFRDGANCGGWLRHTELVTQNKTAVVFGGNVSPIPITAPSNEPKTDASNVTFQQLTWMLPAHLDIPELYFLITALMMGQPMKLLPGDTKFNLDTVWGYLWGVSLNTQPASSVVPRIHLCAEAVVMLLTIARSIINHKDMNALPAWLKQHPVAIVQVLFSLYQNLPDFMPIFMSGEVLSALANTLFPFATAIGSTDSSGASSPAAISVDDEDVDVVVLDGLTDDVGLTNHDARKHVVDFIRVIVIDSLSLSFSGSKVVPVIDLALDAYPEHSTITQQSEYQTEILSTLMDHLLAADMLVGDQAAIPIVPLAAAHVQNIVPNVCYLTARCVDKLWQATLTKDPHDVFDFIVKLIAQAKRRTNNFSLENLYHCLNRTTLFLLSRATDTIADQMSVLEALHKLTTYRLIIFGAGNHELEFVGCLVYCLVQLIADMKIALEVNVKTTWHVNPASADVEACDGKLNQHQGRNLMVGAALRVWEELYACKKPAIEEVFKITLQQPTGNARAPDLMGVREQINEPATQLWLKYIDAERKATYRVPWEIHTQIQSKIHKVTGGLTRLASRSKVKREETAKVKIKISPSRFFNAVTHQVNLVREYADMKRNQFIHQDQHTQRYVYEEWLQTENELTRERGLWGPPTPSALDKWQLDITEGPSRMRKKMMRNDLFYFLYPYRPEYDKAGMKYKVATSFDSKLYYTLLQKRCGQRSLTEATNAENSPLFAINAPDVNNFAPIPSPVPALAPFNLPPIALARLRSEADTEPNDDTDMEEDVQVSVPDNQTLLRLLEENEKVSHMFRCARIQGLDTSEGLLLFGQEHCYIIDGFTLLKNREIRDIESLPSTIAYEPIVPSPGGASSGKTQRTIKHCSKFSYDDIREVHKRRYLLQPMALEVFSGDGRNYLLAFPRKVRNKVYQRFLATATGIADSAAQSVAGQKRTANVEQATSILSNLIGDTSVTQRWVRGEISNFQYLMHLNTLAGRSYNDLMQYPVFPWILADYDSEELDLTDPSTFRDLSKPMGAQSPERLEQFRKRYREWDDPHGETPPYHYGTHYSSAMIVCSYLVRMEPFTQHFLRLQGGHFDLADRMFHSIKEAWLSASKNNMADVKELIPEFFYLPEFLCNMNNFDLGVKQNGTALGHVILPPWAKQDSREYIRVHREALECDYVSQHLNQWIDLIFGCKQKGAGAVQSTNVFHHLFYEGNVDIYNIDDPLKKNATIGFINNFGQIPKQLFKKPHPVKKMANLSSSNRTSLIMDTGSLAQVFAVPQPEKLFYHHLDNLKPSLQPIKEVKGPAGQILCVDKSILAVEQNKVLLPPTYSKFVAWGFADHSLRVGHYDNDKPVFICESIIQNCAGEIVACVSPTPKILITAGTGSVVTVWNYDAREKKISIKQSLYAHTDAVTCLAASAAYNVIVSGSRDCTAVIWDLTRGVFVRQLRGHTAPVAAVAINDQTGDIATCAATWLHIWSINGDKLASVNTCVGRADRMQQILCVAFSQAHEWDAGNVIMTGSTDGVVRMWSIEYVQCPDDGANLTPSGTPTSYAKTKENSVSSIKSVSSSLSEEPPSVPTTPVRKPISNQGRLIKQVNVLSTSQESNSGSYPVGKSASESSLSEDSLAVASSPKIKTEFIAFDDQLNDDVLVEGGDHTPGIPTIVRRRPSRVNNVFRKSEGGSADDTMSELSVDDNNLILRTSKSDTSLTDSFIVVSDVRKPINPANVLKPGFKWQRQLMFRSKLTMHTAYDRKDNAEPASVTSLAVSKDHRTVYVGDARGRIFSWSVCDSQQIGRTIADHWLKDDGADRCHACNVRFTIYERKHHCRNCGLLFCSKCSRFESEISRLRIFKPVRVCQTCHKHLREQR